MQLWAVQTKLAQEDATKFLVDAFQKLGLNWAAFPVRPFEHHIPDFQWDGPIVYYGSTGLVKRVWENETARAGARLFYDPERHATSWYGARLGEAWLNHGAQRFTVGDILDGPDFACFGFGPDFFCRPDRDLKAFAGKVYTYGEFLDLMKRSLDHDAVTRETVIVMNAPTEIEREYRTWWIGGEVAAVVGYKTGDRVKPWDVSEDERCEIAAYSKEHGAHLAELEAFVLDVAVTPRGLRVVEINDIHASGFYLTEHILDVVAELSNYVAKNPTQCSDEDYHRNSLVAALKVPK